MREGREEGRQAQANLRSGREDGICEGERRAGGVAWCLL